MKTAARRTERAPHGHSSAWTRACLVLLASCLVLGLAACTGPGLDPPKDNSRAATGMKAAKDAGSSPASTPHDGHDDSDQGSGAGGSPNLGPADAAETVPDGEDEDAGVVH